MDMLSLLTSIATRIGTERVFTARDLGTRAGKIRLFPVGIGSALEKARREGLIVTVSEGSRRRGRAYAFTIAGRLLANGR